MVDTEQSAANKGEPAVDKDHFAVDMLLLVRVGIEQVGFGVGIEERGKRVAADKVFVGDNVAVEMVVVNKVLVDKDSGY